MAKVSSVTFTHRSSVEDGLFIESNCCPLMRLTDSSRCSIISPQVILLDELGGMDELYALEQGLFSGVEFIATLHAASWEEAARRPQVQYLQKCGALHVAVLLKGRTAPGQLKEVRAS